MFDWKYSPDIKSQTILAISKDEGMLNIWLPFFKSKNYAVISENTVKDGLKTSDLFSPALIISNLDLPHNEQLEFCHQLRKTTNGAILLLSTRHKDFEVSHYYQAGINEFIATPVNPMAVLIKSITWLARQEEFIPRRELSQAYA